MLSRSLTVRSAVLSTALGTMLLLAGCGTSLESDKSLTLQVTGTRGTMVVGEYILTDGSATTRHPLDRAVPFSIELSGRDLSCVLQKVGGAGTVRAQLLVDGQRVAFAWTKERYGNLNVDTP